LATALMLAPLVNPCPARQVLARTLHHWMVVWIILAIGLSVPSAAGATANAPQFEARAAALAELRNRDALEAQRTATVLLSELSADDTENEPARLVVFDVYTATKVSDGDDADVRSVAARGLTIAQRRHDANYEFAMRAVVAFLDYDRSGTEATVAALDALARQADSISNLQTRVRFLISYYEALIDGPRIGEAIRGLRRLQDIVTSNPELDFFTRRLLSKFAHVHEATGDTYSEIIALQDALRLAEENQDATTTRYALHQLGRTYGYAGEYEKSNSFLIRAAARSEAYGDRNRVFFAYRNLARNYIAMRDYAAARSAALRAIADSPSTSTPYDLGTLHLYLVRAYLGLGQRALASETYAVAQTYEKKVSINDRWAAESHRALSELKEQQNDPAGALAELKLAETALNAAQKSELKTRVQAMRFVSNAHDLDYRTLRVERERNQAQLELQRSENEVRSWVFGTALVAALGLAAGAFAWRKRGQAKAFERRLETDSLTGAYSRSAIDRYLHASYVEHKKSGSALALLLLDVNAFKRVNDAHGHAAGDMALQWVVGQARSALSAPERVGRLGGDEFLVVLPGADFEDASETARRVQAAVAAQNSAFAFSVGVSIGVSSTSEGPHTVEELLKRADDAMYAFKRNRKSAMPAAL
jgi:diguanylate cyclase (GGDEF)-like protein